MKGEARGYLGSSTKSVSNNHGNWISQGGNNTTIKASLKIEMTENFAMVDKDHSLQPGNQKAMKAKNFLHCYVSTIIVI